MVVDLRLDEHGLASDGGPKDWQRSRGINSETELNGFFFLGATITGEWQSADCTNGCDEIAKRTGVTFYSVKSVLWSTFCSSPSRRVTSPGFPSFYKRNSSLKKKKGNK